MTAKTLSSQGGSHLVAQMWLCPLQQLHPWMEGIFPARMGLSCLRQLQGCQSLCLSQKAGARAGSPMPAKPHHVHRCAVGCCSPAPSSMEEKATAVSIGIGICWQGWVLLSVNNPHGALTETLQPNSAVTKDVFSFSVPLFFFPCLPLGS